MRHYDEVAGAGNQVYLLGLTQASTGENFVNTVSPPGEQQTLRKPYLQ